MRKFNITLTTNNKSGPFDIYYTSEGENVLASFVSGGYATNVSASQLTAGINILADYGVSNIYAINNKETCYSTQNLLQTPQINPYTCVNLISKNNCGAAKNIQYIDCEGNTQTITINAFNSVSYSGKLNTTTCTSLDCTDCITTIPDPQYCRYYRIINPCTNIAIDIKYIDCSGTSKVVNIGAGNTIILQALANTIYGYSGNCGTTFTKEEIPDPYNPDPNLTCQSFTAANKCSLPAIISYTDCDGNTSTLDIPAGASISYSSLSQDYKCISGDCSCLKVYTPSQTCGFDFSILGEYTPPAPPATLPTYKLVPAKFEMNEGETIKVKVNTTDITPGTTLYWGIFFYTGTSSDLDTPSTGTVTISDNTAEITITAKADATTEPNGNQLIFVRLYPTSGRVYEEILAESKGISIKDTSQTPIQYVCGVNAYDSNNYLYVYSKNQIALSPNNPSSPTQYATNIGEPNNEWNFYKNSTLQPSSTMSPVRLTPSNWAYSSELPFVTSMNFTSSVARNGGDNVSFSGRNKFVYPLNNNMLSFSDTSYKVDLPTQTVPYLKLAPSIGGSYAYIVPRPSTYAVTGSTIFKFRGNDTGGADQAGPAVFRIIGIIEQSTTPNNWSSWTSIAKTTLEPVFSNWWINNKSNTFKYNSQTSTIWYDLDAKDEIEFKLSTQTDISLTSGVYVRFTLYWVDLSGAFFSPELKVASNYLTFSVGGGSYNPSIFSIIDKTKRTVS